jgi:ribonuclease HII
MNASLRTENALRKDGYHLICGIDEVGRGSLAGPLVAACVILPSNWRIGLKDSKQLTASKRQELDAKIKTKAMAFGVGLVGNREIDEKGLTESVRLAYERALENMPSGFSIAIIDGNYDYIKDYQCSRVIVKADSKVACVAAASIIAKVWRDEFMKEQSNYFIGYGFESNVGYATKQHLEKIAMDGITPIHRKSFCRRFL